MPDQVLVDADVLVAFLRAEDEYHDWAAEQLRVLPSPFRTCEAVLSESFHLLRRGRHRPRLLFDLLETGAVALDFSLAGELDAVRALAAEYESVPMSLADACLVRMTEVQRDRVVLTLDSDFRIYRRHGRQAIRVIMPPSAV